MTINLRFIACAGAVAMLAAFTMHNIDVRRAQAAGCVQTQTSTTSVVLIKATAR